jgi:hypothetical protein
MKRSLLIHGVTIAATVSALIAVAILSHRTRFDYRDVVAGAVVLAAVLTQLRSVLRRAGRRRSLRG